MSYKLSARNKFGAKIVKIERGDIISLVRLDSTTPVILTSVMSNEVVDNLGIRAGDRVGAMIESTEVMFA